MPKKPRKRRGTANPSTNTFHPLWLKSPLPLPPASKVTLCQQRHHIGCQGSLHSGIPAHAAAYYTSAHLRSGPIYYLDTTRCAGLGRGQHPDGSQSRYCSGIVLVALLSNDNLEFPLHFHLALNKAFLYRAGGESMYGLPLLPIPTFPSVE